MRILVRVDAGTELGFGHVMRCLALSIELRNMGVKVYFATRYLPGGAIKLIRDSDFEIEEIPSETHADRLHSTPQCKELSSEDIKATLGAAKRIGAQCILIDHYGATSDYLSAIRLSGLHLALIDDIADRDLTAVDWLLNQNLGAENLTYNCRPDCVKLFGPNYALIQPVFSERRQQLLRTFSEEDNRVLVTLGGGDNTNLCVKILEAIKATKIPLDVRCILPSIGTLPATVLNTPHKLNILNKVTDMEQHMVWADLSINAGGSTCWELCCLGTPMIIVVLSPDQKRIAISLAKEECALCLDEWEASTTPDKLVEATKTLLKNPEQRSAMVTRSQALVDGFGAERTAQSLIGRISQICSPSL